MSTKTILEKREEEYPVLLASKLTKYFSPDIINKRTLD